MKQVATLIKKYILILLIGVVAMFLLNNLLGYLYIRLVVNTNTPLPQSVIAETAAALTVKNDTFTLSDEAGQMLAQKNIWAMLLDDQTGNVLWSDRLPEEIPQNFTATDIAKFSRAYLKDYPVFVWEHPDGLLVLGYPKDSYTKQLYNATLIKVYRFAPIGLLIVLACNVVLLFLLYYFAQSRTLRAITPLVNGIDDLAKGRTVTLDEKEPFPQLAREVNQVSERLRKKETARANWISGVSHDIRTPLSVILGYAEELGDSPALSSQAKRQVAYIRFHAERIRNLVNDLNLSSKLEYNMQPLHMQTIYVTRLLRQMAADFLNRGMDDKYDITCNVAGVSSGLSVSGDLSLLQRALENLISNSILHNPDGCRITLSAQGFPGRVALVVSDSGIGMTEEQLEKLRTQPHYMMCDSSTHDQRHGLGLRIVRQIVQSHDGELHINQGAQGGFEAKLFLPVNDGKECTLNVDCSG